MKLLLLACPFLLLVGALNAATPSGVQVIRKVAGFELLHNGAPYFIKGGGGAEEALEALAQAGGNSVRLWGDEHLGEVLERAQKLGLTVTAGAICFACCWFYAAAGRRLIGETVDQRVVDGMTRSVIPGVPINAAATLVALWSPHTALALFAALALFYVIGSSLFGRE